MTRRILGPINRVEGDLELRLAVEGDRVAAAWVNSPLYRGFERMLLARPPEDALVMVPRICGICSVAQSMAAAAALADAQGLEMPRNGRLVHAIVLAAENVADHITHFYLFFMPDFARDVYAGEPWFAPVAERFRALRGTASRELLPARAAFQHILGSLAGHWPHTLGMQPGGTTSAVSRATRARVLAQLAGFRRFLESRLFGASLESVAALSSQAELQAWARMPGPAASDFGAFLRLVDALELASLGRGTDRFISFGAYRLPTGHVFAPGVFEAGRLRALDVGEIAEDVASSWYAPQNAALHPSAGVTLPDAQAEAGYSWCKAPRLAGQVVEVGALARLVIDGHPLARDLVAQGGGNVASRVIARMLEIARVVLAMQDWIAAIEPDAPFHLTGEMSDVADGVGLVEAARGSLGHWLSVRGGKIASYQIVAPTTWNFSPRDSAGQPGACEQALVGAPVRQGESEPVAVQHILRSFDPCMVCTVH